MKKIILIAIIFIFGISFSEMEQEEIKTLPSISFYRPYCNVLEDKCVVKGYRIGREILNKNAEEELGYYVNDIHSIVESADMIIIGHTDNTGSDKLNKKISLERAEYVAKKLREYGLKEEIRIIDIQGAGSNNPVDTNTRVEGRYNNRRVELIFRNIIRKEYYFKNE